MNDQFIDEKTGEVYSSKEWIIREWNGKITKVKRISDKQLAFIESLEYRLGYKPKSHRNMPAYKAVAHINKLLERIKTKEG